MRRNRFAFAALAVVGSAVVALALAVTGGSAKKTPSSVAAGSSVSLRQTSLGQTLVDANGRTLYLFQGDTANVSTLSGAGLAVWPAFRTTAAPRATGGASAALIGTIAGYGGERQVTYNGHPLYYYVGDQKPGDTRGQNLNQFGALWYVLSAQGNAVTTAPSTAASPSTPSTAGYGSGY